MKLRTHIRGNSLNSEIVAPPRQRWRLSGIAFISCADLSCNAAAELSLLYVPMSAYY
jgi:hypothetical protein